MIVHPRHSLLLTAIGKQMPILGAVMIAVTFLLLSASASPAEAEEYVLSSTDILGVHNHPRAAADHRKAIDLGAKVVNLPNHNAFFVFWLPSNFERFEDRRLLVMLHDTGGNAYQCIDVMSEAAGAEGFGIVSVQWGHPTGPRGELTYMTPEETYKIIELALDYMNLQFKAEKHSSAWLGFSRSATHCVTFAYLDRGDRFFKLFIAVSGGIGANLPLVRDLRAGQHGRDPLSGRHFYLWCGSQDNNGRVCQAVSAGAVIIRNLGGTVDLLRQTRLGHAGYFHERQYQREALEIWKSLSR